MLSSHLCSSHFLQFALLVSQRLSCLLKFVSECSLAEILQCFQLASIQNVSPLLFVVHTCLLSCRNTDLSSPVRVSVFNCLPSSDKSQLSLIAVVSSMTCFRAGMALRIASSPGAYVSMCLLMSWSMAKRSFPIPISQWRRGVTYLVRGMNGHHGLYFTPSFGSVVLASAIIPQLTSSSIVHISLCSSRNCFLGALKSMHHHPDIDSFPRAIA
jgi:hypothetical protein